MTGPAYRIRFSDGTEPAYRASEGGALTWARYKVELLAHQTVGEAWTTVEHRGTGHQAKWREIHRLKPRAVEAAT